MFVLDDRYLTIVAFLEGCSAATGGRLLDGFHDWVQHHVGQGESSLHWSSQIAIKHGVMTGAELSDDLNEVVIADLFAMLDEFLADSSEEIDAAID